MINDFISNLKYIAPEARKKAVRQLFKLLGKWLLLLPILLIYTIVAFPLTLFTMFVISGKDGVRDAMDELSPKDYWTMDGVFNNYRLKFTCSKCGHEMNYVATLNEVKRFADKAEGTWSWYNPKNPTCYSCISKKN